jgi:CBS-domain-containing membrane protein
MLTIADIMTDEVFCVASTASVEDVAWALAIRNIGGAPVSDGHGRLIGTVTKAQLCDPVLGMWSRGSRFDPLLAEDVMSPRLHVAQADEPAISAVKTLSVENVRQIVVVDRDGHVVGIVTPTDVLKALVHGDRFTDDRGDRDRAAAADEPWEPDATAG